MLVRGSQAKLQLCRIAHQRMVLIAQIVLEMAHCTLLYNPYLLSSPAWLSCVQPHCTMHTAVQRQWETLSHALQLIWVVTTTTHHKPPAGEIIAPDQE